MTTNETGTDTPQVTPGHRILVVEDEADLADVVAYNLRGNGMEVDVVGTVTAARHRLEQQPLPNLVVLDLMLPDSPGTELCRWIRSNRATQGVSVLIASARDDEIDRIVGFEVGADDYLVKPYSVRELVLRVRAILRRRPPQTVGDVIEVGRLSLDAVAHRARLGDSELVLSPTEFRLLWVLAAARGRVITREALLHALGEDEPEGDSRRIDARLRRLRAKLGSHRNIIETVRGVGHRIGLDLLE